MTHFTVYAWSDLQWETKLKHTAAEQFRLYQAKYPQQVRDIAETCCASTTRLSTGARTAQVSLDELRALALRHGVDIDALTAAVADYAAFEEQAETEQRQRGRLPK